MGARIRLIIIAVLLALSVVVDSVYYLVSAVTDAVFIGLAIVAGWPLIKSLLQQR